MLSAEPIVKVAIFEDNRYLLQSMELVLNNSEGIACTGAFPDCNDLMKDMLRANPNVVLMDIEMPGMNGIEATRLIRHHFSKVQVIIQTIFDSNEKIFDAICAGAAGYVLKNSHPDDWANMIRSVIHGGAPMSATIASKVLDLLRKPNFTSAKSNVRLTEREREILSLLVEGCAYKEVANRLFISFFTVQSHIKNIYGKLEVNSKTEAVSKTLQERLLRSYLQNPSFMG